MTYTLLSGDDANYAGMASAYRRHLLASGGLPDKAAPLRPYPGLYPALMADQAKSLFGRSTKVFTTLQDVTGWVDRLREQDIGSSSSPYTASNREDTAAEKRAAISWRAASAAKRSCRPSTAS